MRKFVITLVFLLITAHYITPQNAKSYAQKAKFIVNFTLFTVWPNENPETDTSLIGVYGKAHMTKAINQVIDQRQNINRRLKAIPLDNISKGTPPEGLKVIYVASENARAKHVGAYIEQRPILTVGDNNKCTDNSFMLNLGNTGENVNFTINKKAAELQGLKFKYQLYQQGEVINTE